jgi:CBS domain-containing protein
MTAPVVTATPSMSLEDVARLMLQRRIGCVVIVSTEDPQHPRGIVTETDFEVSEEPIPLALFEWPRLFGKAVWSQRSMEDVYERARRRTAESIMSSPVVTVEADAPLWEAVTLMVRGDIKRVPAIGGGQLVGIVSRHDLLKCLVPEATSSSEA